MEALNEPAGFKNDNFQLLNTTKKFYEDGYQIVRKANTQASSAQNMLYAIHDAFQPLSYWFSFDENKTNVALDTHIYTIFSVEAINLDLQSRIKTYCDMIPRFKDTQSHIGLLSENFPRRLLTVRNI